MTHEEAVEKAKVPNPAKIPRARAEDASALVGGIIEIGRTGGWEIIGWIGQNYLLRATGRDRDEYQIAPVMWVLKNLV